MSTTPTETSDEILSHWNAIQCLRIVIFLQCLGVGGRYLISSNESESDVYGFLFFDRDWPETIAQQIDDWGMTACFLAGWVIIAGALIDWIRLRNHRARKTSEPVNPSLRLHSPLFKTWRIIECTACCVVAAWILLLASAHMVRGDIYAELSLGEQAVRFISPLVLLLMLTKPNPRRIALGFLAIASFSTFAVHGYKALNCYGPFTDLILLTSERFALLKIDQSTAEYSLYIIGGIDIVVAFLLLSIRWRSVAMYMVFWGMITASSRMTALGWSAWPETLIRAANWGAPLAVLLLMKVQTKNSDNENK